LNFSQFAPASEWRRISFNPLPSWVGVMTRAQIKSQTTSGKISRSSLFKRHVMTWMGFSPALASRTNATHCSRPLTLERLPLLGHASRPNKRSAVTFKILSFSVFMAHPGHAGTSQPGTSAVNASTSCGEQSAFSSTRRRYHVTIQFNAAFCTCNRFSACVKIVSALASNVSSSISLPRYAGRQCITSASGFASLSSFWLIW